MREILFRGQTRRYGEKVKLNGEKIPGNWVYGGIYPGTGDFSIIYGWNDDDEHTGANLKKFVVYSDTVGQYTGMTDKNGVRIFDGDILQNALGTKGRVSWYPEHAAFMVYAKEDAVVCFLCASDFSLVEVIGNVHDNPELLD